LAVVPRPLSRFASLVLDRGAQADTCGATPVLERGAHAVALGGACCVSQVLGHGVQANICDAAQVL
jgi:hypothetical protein